MAWTRLLNCDWCGSEYASERTRRPEGNYCPGSRCRTGAYRIRQKIERLQAEIDKARERLLQHRKTPLTFALRSLLKVGSRYE